MLKKYSLVNVPKGGVDHIVNGRRVAVNSNMTDEEAEVMKAAGLPYFQPKSVSTPKPATNGKAKTNAVSPSAKPATTTGGTEASDAGTAGK